MWVKVCGFTRAAEIATAIRLGVDAVGLVLAPQSPRVLEAGAARRLADTARAAAVARGRPVDVVGVFSGQSPAEVVAAARTIPLDVVQLHGGEPEELAWLLHERLGLRIIRTLWPGDPQDGGRVTPAPIASPSAQPHRWAYLLDARHNGRAGGTGHAIPLATLGRWVATLGRRHRVIVAGGIRPETVGQLLRAVQPWGIDVSSGVEVTGRPGVKDPAAIARLVHEVRAMTAV